MLRVALRPRSLPVPYLVDTARTISARDSRHDCIQAIRLASSSKSCPAMASSKPTPGAGATNIVTKEKVYEEHWQPPTPPKQASMLKVWNSLTRSKVEFVPIREKHITWYNCGPTVYDASHMGHARNYVTQDVLRRILRDYFGYNVHFVMNITDVDDKIIVRARQQHLFNDYLNETQSLSEAVLDSTKEAWQQYFDKFAKDISPSEASASIGSSAGPSNPPLPFTWESLQSRIQGDPVWLRTVKENNEKFGMHMETLATGRAAITKAEENLAGGSTGREAAQELLLGTRDVVSVWLDKQKGSSVSDPAIFRTLAAYWEKLFFDDMARLHVEPPTTLTRVSEYVPEIATFVEGIINNGYAYETEDGSVYFDTKRFDGAKGKGSAEAGSDWCHTYAKLEPWSKGNRDLLLDGEGSLTTTAAALKTKKSPSDFALWKASKPGEPAWPSKWGPGRPGWHIECSVMASEVLGERMDVHSGGVDLAFPHHDNEIAQSEAYHECRQWVNYFLHTGHLHIEGLKMSKSLKNFITIEEALEKSSARQLRLAFLQQSWNARMDFKESNMAEVRAQETMINNFYTNVRALKSDREATAYEDFTGQHQYRQAEKDLQKQLREAQTNFHEHLCDSFNTPAAMQDIFELLSSTNVYLNSRSRKDVNLDVLLAVSSWTSSMLRMLGLGEGSEADAFGRPIIGWGLANVDGAEGAGDRESVLMPYLRALSAFRDSIRQLARENAKPSEILALCDQLRDQEMVDLGVALDDQEDGRALVKLVPAEQLRAARAEKAAAAKEKADRKAAQQAAEEAKRREKLEKGRTPPQELFKTGQYAGPYSKWDDEGIPTHDSKGEEVTKSAQKKLKKLWDQQQKLHEAFLAASST